MRVRSHSILLLKLVHVDNVSSVSSLESNKAELLIADCAHKFILSLQISSFEENVVYIKVKYKIFCIPMFQGMESRCNM